MNAIDKCERMDLHVVWTHDTWGWWTGGVGVEVTRHYGVEVSRIETSAYGEKLVAGLETAVLLSTSLEC